ncbi:MAG: ABC transporter substrate-binding protein [Propioniciclava sp.]
MKRTFAAMGGLAAGSLLLTGCLSTGDGAATTAETPGEESAQSTVSILYAFSGSQSETFQEDMDAWAEGEGITIEYTQSDAFEEVVSTSVSSGNAPDIAIFPQPGILTSLATDGHIADLATQVDLPALEADIVPGFLDAATVDGTVYGAPMSMNGKSLYWYSKKNFAAAGYEVPTTHAELLTLIDTIKSDGKTPVCYGLESGPATGWPGTDWIEDYVLQTSGPEVYDQWVAGDIKFDSPEIRKAFAAYDEIIMAEGNVYGEAKNASSIAFGQALNPMFDEDPKCYFGKQGNFITQSGFFPEAIHANMDEEVGMFVTPSVSGESPFLGGGDLAAAFTKNDANVKKVMAFMTTDPAFGDAQSQSGSWLSPLQSFDTSKYPSDTLRDVVSTIQEASVFRFDGSDLMPGAVGAGTFWQGMVSYTAGNTDLDTTLANIDAGWPA